MAFINKNKSVESQNLVTNNEETENEKKDINIYDVELEENQGITKDGLVFDETLVLNDYKFTLGSNIDEFLKETGTIVKDMEEFNEFKADPDRLFAELDCYIKDGYNIVNFEITVGHDDNHNTVIREININSDAKYENSNFLENPNIITCGFSFLGGHEINEEFTKLPKEILKNARYTEDSYSKNYKLDISAKRGDYYNITISASTSDLESDYYYIDYVIVSSIAY